MTDSVAKVLPVDSDIDQRAPRSRARPRRVPWAVLSVISAGGVLGAEARYGLGRLFPAAPGEFPWATFGTNVTGCLLIGVLMALIDQVWAGRRLVRPFLGVGVLGGFTTFSTYVVDVQQLMDVGASGTALAYLAGTVVSALAATYLGLVLARRAIGKRAVGRRELREAR